MRFEKALSLMRKHIKIRKPYWYEKEYIWIEPKGKAIITEQGKRYDIDAIEILEEDWGKVKE